MKQSKGDISLFFQPFGRKLVVISVSYVDDILRTGEKSFEDSSTTKISESFEKKEKEPKTSTLLEYKLNEVINKEFIAEKLYILHKASKRRTILRRVPILES